MRLYKTEKGQAAFKQRSPLFSARQRSLFLLLDGKKTAVEVLAATAGLGVSQADVDYLLSVEFLSVTDSAQPPTDAAALEAVAPPDAVALAPRPPQQRYLEAKPIATQLTASLGLRGFLLNLAVESAAGYDELLQLLPRIQGALGAKACRKLERALLE
jgi:hypothetical protein